MAQAPREHTPLTEQDFRGLFAHGNNDTVPPGFFIDTLNVKYNRGIAQTRDGSEIDLSQANIVRYFEYRKIGENPRYIYLDSSGNLFDSLFPGVPIYTDAAFVDFSMTVMYNRAYITPHNRQEGTTSKKVLVYTGTGTARIAAGVAPTSFTLAAVESGSSGSCETGVHLVAIAYGTDTGFITAPGTGSGIAEVTVVTGDRKIDVSSIPLGSSYVTKRYVLATKSILPSLYTGNKLGYEFFFVPGGTIDDNVTTTKSLDFYDIDLVDSADYLFDNLDSIPAGVAIFSYNSRLAVANEDGNNWTVRLSEPLAPETFSAIDGFLTVDPSESVSGIRNGFEFRKNLILTSTDRFFATSDNGQSPSTWEVTVIDKSVGADCFCVSTMLDARGTGNDRVWVATRAGLISFEGYVKKPELSDNIEDLWKRINKTKFDLVQVVDEPLFHRVFISVPLDSATAISHVIVGDYQEAFTVYNTIDQNLIKWSIWTFPSAPLSIHGSRDITTGKPVFGYSTSAGIYLVKDGLTADFGNAIDSYAQFSLKTAMEGWVNHFGSIRFRISGSGTLAVTLNGEDGTLTANAPSIVLSSAPGKEYEIPINFVNEKCSVKIRLNTFGSYFILNKMELFAKGLWVSRS
jgi:hypothetical protein